ncbi:hydrogenase [Sorangium cellulosum]|uniref:Hydrogenase n=1 Tax=Sorangium cellulosum TaxID=56 RepID=A0A4P2Q4F0_SORCE|nr:hydrogenase expression/formation protein HypE [Sorangium cellulosum]AUX24247.1 hydrogenase [Sorangium cellulosum]
MSDAPDLTCPLPCSDYPRVVLAHGGGGRVMHRLIRELFVAAFDSPWLAAGHDGAVIDPGGGALALTTDAFTVRPLFFPGGDIGSLAVHGTVNDLAMCGARPRYLTASFVLEEGLPLDDLRRVVASMAGAARRSGVAVVAGDTKVVERGKGDGVYIAVTGVGQVESRAPIAPERVRPGDVVLVSGPVGDHGVAVMTAREGIGIETDLVSDSAPVADAVLALIRAGVDVRCLRDPTRGGLATVLCEIASAAGIGVRVAEEAIPVRPAVADACELLGLDPCYVACEGRFVAFVPEADGERALAILRATPGGEGARRIGRATSGPPGTVVLEGALGGERVLDMLSGEQLPRIC